MGVVSPFGMGVPRFFSALLEGRSAARGIDTFDASAMPTRFWASLPMEDAELLHLLPQPRVGKVLTRSGRMAMIAAEEAMDQAGIDHHRLDGQRFGISVGAGGVGLVDTGMSPLDEQVRRLPELTGRPFTSTAETWGRILNSMHPLNPVRSIPNSIAAHLSIRHQALGSSLTYTTACTSSAQAIGEAWYMIREGRQDVMLAGGADSGTNPSSIISFSLLGALSTRNEEFQTASRPFDRTRDGFMLGEGAAFLVLESERHCLARGGTPLAELAGYGTASDAYRVTDEPEDARGAIRAMLLALGTAGLSPSLVGHINAHGTSTRMNDPIESLAIRTVFGREAEPLPVTSIKSMIGHAIAASGALELVAAAETLRSGEIPPTINTREVDPECPLDIVLGACRPWQGQNVLSNSFGFGGQNASLVIRRL